MDEASQMLDSGARAWLVSLSRRGRSMQDASREEGAKVRAASAHDESRGTGCLLPQSHQRPFLPVASCLPSGNGRPNVGPN